jgi:hypothetical protein
MYFLQKYGLVLLSCLVVHFFPTQGDGIRHVTDPPNSRTLITTVTLDVNEQLTQYQKSCIKVHSLKLNLMCDFVFVDCKITMAHLENGTPISSQQAHTLLLKARRQKPVFSQQSRKISSVQSSHVRIKCYFCVQFGMQLNLAVYFPTPDKAASVLPLDTYPL